MLIREMTLVLVLVLVLALSTFLVYVFPSFWADGAAVVFRERCGGGGAYSRGTAKS